jgi:hypothetical protein
MLRADEKYENPSVSKQCMKKKTELTNSLSVFFAPCPCVVHPSPLADPFTVRPYPINQCPIPVVYRSHANPPMPRAALTLDNCLPGQLLKTTLRLCCFPAGYQHATV